MSTYQFADISKVLSTQIKVAEHLVKDDLYGEANTLLLTAKDTLRNLESLMTLDNKIQKHIIENRQRDINWIHDAIQHGVNQHNTAVKSIKSAKKSRK